MTIETATWGAIGVGHIVRDQKDRLHTVIAEKNGWVQLKAAKTGEVASVRRPATDRPVDIYVPTEAEIKNLLVEELGARYLREIEEREHAIARRLNWRIDPILRNVSELWGHLSFIHNMAVDDVVNRYNGTKVNPSSREQKKAALDELAAAHDAAHEDPGTFPGRYAHYHAVA